MSSKFELCGSWKLEIYMQTHLCSPGAVLTVTVLLMNQYDLVYILVFTVCLSIISFSF